MSCDLPTSWTGPDDHGAARARRRPASTRMRERVQLAGLIVVGFITVLALRNDLTRDLLA